MFKKTLMTLQTDKSRFFYKRKLNVYNLTSCFTLTKKVYCTVWNETISGRAGNNIAKAFRRILDTVIEENEITELITWSNSCIPQNRNSHISNAVLNFLKENPIQHHFCHSEIISSWTFLCSGSRSCSQYY